MWGTSGDSRSGGIRSSCRRFAQMNADQICSRSINAYYAFGTKNLIAQKVSAATIADAGIVNTQAQTICLATPHRTAERREVEPTPTIAPVMVCVVLTGMP